MYISVRRYQTTGPLEEIARRVREGFVPIIRAAPGFIAFYVLTPGDGTLSSVSVFADRAGAEASVRLSAEHVRANLADLLSLTDTTAGDVIVYEAAP